MAIDPISLATLAVTAGGKVADFFGRKSSQEHADARADANTAMQREFAQHGIRWRVEDAKAAGIHPLYALGAQTHSFSPVQVGSENPAGAFADMGQDISRAIDATRTADERTNSRLEALTLERAGLQNDLLRAQIAKLAPNQVGPPAPGSNYLIDGQTDSGPAANTKPLERVQSAPGAPQSEHAAIPDVGYARTKTGWAPVPSKDVKERIEDNLIQELMWTLRNNILPSFGVNQSPPVAGYQFNPFRQEYFKPGPPRWDRRLFGRR